MKCSKCEYEADTRIGGCALTHKDCDSCGKDVLHATTATDLLCDECSDAQNRCKVCGIPLNSEPTTHMES